MLKIHAFALWRKIEIKWCFEIFFKGKIFQISSKLGDQFICYCTLNSELLECGSLIWAILLKAWKCILKLKAGLFSSPILKIMQSSSKSEVKLRAYISGRCGVGGGGGHLHILVYTCMNKKQVKRGFFAVEREKQGTHLWV